MRGRRGRIWVRERGRVHARDSPVESCGVGADGRVRGVGELDGAGVSVPRLLQCERGGRNGRVWVCAGDIRWSGVLHLGVRVLPAQHVGGDGEGARGDPGARVQRGPGGDQRAVVCDHGVLQRNLFKFRGSGQRGDAKADRERERDGRVRRGVPRRGAVWKGVVRGDGRVRAAGVRERPAELRGARRVDPDVSRRLFNQELLGVRVDGRDMLPER